MILEQVSQYAAATFSADLNGLIVLFQGAVVNGFFSLDDFFGSISSSLVTKLLKMLRERFWRINLIEFADDK